MEADRKGSSESEATTPRCDERTSHLRVSEPRRLSPARLLLIVGIVLVLASGYGLAILATELHASVPGGAPLGVDLPYPCTTGGPPYPNVTLSSYTGAGFSTVTISGIHFATYGAVNLYWVQGPADTGTYQSIGSVAVSSSGSFSDPFSLPPAGPGYSDGKYNVTAQDTYDDCGSANYTLTSPTPRQPQLTIESPTSGIGGTATSVDGSYFYPGATISPVEIGGDTVSCSGGSPVVSGTGSFSCDFAVPLSLAPGSYYVTAYDSVDGTIQSTNEFLDTGGQTTTSVACSPEPFGSSGSAESAEFSTNCTATVSGNSPSGTVTWSTSSSTGTFFTWELSYGVIDYTTTDTCSLDLSGQCTISYSDTSTGSPTITGTYGGNSDNEPSAGDEVVSVVATTTTSTEVTCLPSEVTGSEPAMCTATVSGEGPTGTVDWTAETGSDLYIPTLSASSCTLVSGSCAVTVTSPTYPYLCPPTQTGGCGLEVTVNAEYRGDSINDPSTGNGYIYATELDDEYESYTDYVNAGVPETGSCGECDDIAANSGGFGSEGAGGASSYSNATTGALGTFSGFSSALGSETSVQGLAENLGYGEGTVFGGDTLSVGGSCDLSEDSSNLGACLDFSVFLDGYIDMSCTHGQTLCGYALGEFGDDVEACDLDPNSNGGSGACSGGAIGADACLGDECDELAGNLYSDFNPIGADSCPGGYGDLDGWDCLFSGSLSVSADLDAQFSFGGGDDIASGDALDFTSQAYGGVEASSDAYVDLMVDPLIEVVNLDPSQLSLSVTSAETQEAENPSVLEVSNVITPTTTSAGSTVNDTATLTNTGSSALTNVSAFGSIEGPLKCQYATLGVSDSEHCWTNLTSLPEPGEHTDYVIANGTNASDDDVVGSSSASFDETPVLYNVNFTETGLAPHTPWSVIVNDTILTSTAENITASLPFGTYSYTVVPPPGSTATPPNGTVSVVSQQVNVSIVLAPGIPGPVVGALSTLLGLYAQNQTLQTDFPAANSTIGGLAALVGWAADVVQGEVPPTNFSSLAPYGPWYVLMGVYNNRPDLQAAFPQAYGNPANFSELVDWAGEVVNDSFPDSDASVLAPFGPWYVLMLTYDQRPDLRLAFPQAYTNYTNYSGLVAWAGEVVTGDFPDSSEAALAPFGAYYDLLYVYEIRPDLQAVYPDAFTNETSYVGLVEWAGGVTNGSFYDSDVTLLAPYGYWYVLFGWVYEDRSDLLAVYPDAFTNGASYEGLFVWASGVVQSLYVDTAYYTLLPYASTYERLG